MKEMPHAIDSAFKLKRPCSNCPFLKEGAIDLRPGRLEGIIHGLVSDDTTTFHCHKTVHGKQGGQWIEHDNGESTYVPSNKESMCAGAMAYLEKVGRPNIIMRIGQMTGHYHPDQLAGCLDDVIEPIN